MSCYPAYPASGSNAAHIPGTDYNIQTPGAQQTGTANPPVSVGEEVEQTPAFLQKMLDDIKRLRQEQSELYAKMYPQPKKLGADMKQPEWEIMEEYSRQDAELDQKLSGLKGRVRELATLLAQETPPRPALE